MSQQENAGDERPSVTNDITKTALAGLGTARQGLSYGFGASRKWMMGKLGKNVETPEDPEFVSMVERLQSSEKDFAELTKRSKKLHDAQIALTKSQDEFREALSSMQSTAGSTLAPTLLDMADNMQRLGGFQETASQSYTTDIIHPIRELSDEMRDTVKMVLAYRVAKQDYDYAHSAVMQLEAGGSQGGPKLEAAQKKLQAASDKYEQIKSELRDRCTAIDSLKNFEVQSHVSHYLEAQLQYFEQCHSFMKERIKEGNRLGVYSANNSRAASPLPEAIIASVGAAPSPSLDDDVATFHPQNGAESKQES